MSEFNILVDGGKTKKLLTAGKYLDRDILVTALDAIAYDDAKEGDRLYKAGFSSECFTPIDDSSGTVENNGTIYDGYGAYTPSGWTGEHRRNLAKFPIVGEHTALKVDGSDTTGVADHRYVGHFPMYDLENKTYTCEFEYFRNYEKRHKFYFACGTFIDKETGSTINGDWCDTYMPCLAIQLGKSSAGKITYNLVRQSSIIYNNTTNVHNSNTVDFVMEEARGDSYQHDISFPATDKNYTERAPLKATIINQNANEYYSDEANWEGADAGDDEGCRLFFLDTISSILEGATVEWNGITGTAHCVKIGEEYYCYELEIQILGGNGEVLATVLPYRHISDTVTFLPATEGGFTAKLKVILKGGAKERVTLWKGHGGLVKPSNAGARWVGNIIPIDFEIYHTVNGEDLLIADGCVYQPADVPLVCGVGDWEVLPEGKYYGIRNLTIYKGDRTTVPLYRGAYVVKPSTEEQTLKTAGQYLDNDVTVLPMKDSEDVYKGTFTIVPSTARQVILTAKKYLDENIEVSAMAKYEGESVVTPSEDEQTLPTAGKYLDKDITVNPIPHDTEVWKLTLEDGSVVTKEVYVK